MYDNPTSQDFFIIPAKIGQTFNQYSEEIKKEAVRLIVEEVWVLKYLNNNLTRS